MSWSFYNTAGFLKVNTGRELVSTLPSSPVNGQEIYYQADGTNGVIWHLRYRAASASAYKWEFVGGGALTVSTGAQVSNPTYPTANTWVDIGAAVSLPALPLAGDYWVEASATVYNRVAATLGIGVATTAAGTPTYRSYGSSAAVSFVQQVLDQKFIGLAATTTVLTMRFIYDTTTASSISRDGYALTATPIRVG